MCVWVCVSLYIVHVTYVHVLQISFSFNRYALKSDMHIIWKQNEILYVDFDFLQFVRLGNLFNMPQVFYIQEAAAFHVG